MTRKITLDLTPEERAGAAVLLCAGTRRSSRLDGGLRELRAQLDAERQRAEAIRALLDALEPLERCEALDLDLGEVVSEDGDELDFAFEGAIDLDLRRALPDRRAAARWAGPLVRCLARFAELELTEVDVTVGRRRASLAEAIEAVRAAAAALGVRVEAPELPRTARARRPPEPDLYGRVDEDEADEGDGGDEGDDEDDDDDEWDDDDDGDDGGDGDDDFPPGGFGGASRRGPVPPRGEAPPRREAPRLSADLSSAERDFLQRAGLAWPCEAEALRKGRLRVLAAAHPDRHLGRSAAAHEDYVALQQTAESLRARLCHEPHRAAR